MEAAEQASVIVRQDLADAGFLVRDGKLQWIPSQKISWLGFDLDLKGSSISAPSKDTKFTGVTHCLARVPMYNG